MATILDRLPSDFSSLSDEELGKLTADVLQLQAQERQENQLRYYQPVSENAKKIHLTTKKTICIGGGNGASKTDSCLTEMVIRATGQIPLSLRDVYPREKLRGPIACRVVCESLTTTLVPIILPKLQWNLWRGVDLAGGQRGHWGWIPKACLIGGDWRKSWRDRERMLRLYYRDPDHPERIIGESVIQFMCLRGDQRVRTAMGRWMAIEDIREGDVLMSPKGPTRVVKTFTYDNAPVYRIRCTGGREVIATPNHQHFMADGTVRRTSDLLPGDALHTFPINTPISYDEPLPEWLLGWCGIILGDGCTRRKDVGFTATSGSRVLADIPPLPPDTRLAQVAPKEYRIWLTKGRRNNPLVMYLKQEHLWGKTSIEKFVPGPFFTQPPRCVAYFLRHLWNCDGSVNERGRQAMYVTISKHLAYDVKYLLWQLGIYAGVTDGTYPCGFTGKPVHRYTVQVSGGSFDRWNAALAGLPFDHIQIETKGAHGVVKDISFEGTSKVYCVEVDNADHSFVVDGLVTHNSYDQDPSDFASGDFHFILHDEPPPKAIWEENMARAMRVGGTMALAMTWPTDPAIPIDWIYDDLYEKAQPGVDHDDRILWLDLDTTENMNLDQNEVAARASQWSKTVRDARIHGQPIRMANRVHPLFTDITKHWCFTCKDVRIQDANGKCATCQNTLCAFCHVQPIRAEATYPVVFALDPHPRKPHDLIWVQVDPNDDLALIDCQEVDGDPAEVWQVVQRVEEQYGWGTVRRLIDPNMGRSPSDTKRELTWQDAFEQAGLVCDLACDGEVGRRTLDSYLEPDEQVRHPRFLVDPRCTKAVYQMKRYLWGDFKVSQDRDQKQRPKQKHDDIPTLLKYVVNAQPSFRELKSIGRVFRRDGERSAVGY